MRVKIPRLPITVHGDQKTRVALIAGVAFGALLELSPELKEGPDFQAPATKLAAALVEMLFLAECTEEEVAQSLALLGLGWTVEEPGAAS